MRPRWVWTGIAAVVVVVAGVFVVPRLGFGAAPTTPTASPAVTTSASPAATPSRAPAPLRTLTWVQRAASPMDDPSDYTQVSVAGNDYFLRAAKDCGRVVGYRHDVGRDVWRSIRPAPRRSVCSSFSVITGGSDIYVLQYADPPKSTMATSIYHTTSGTWEILRPVAIDSCLPMGLTSGILCSRPGEESLPLRYSFFDYSSERWREGSVDLGVANTGEQVEPVTVAGRPLAMSTVWPADYSIGGTLTLVTFDPATGERVLSTGRELSSDALQAADGNVQVAAPGYAYIGPRSGGSMTTQADLLDLRTGVWAPLKLPVQGATRVSDAEWVFDYYGAEAAGYAAANGYLYEPATQRWLAVPTDGVAPPDVDAESQESMTRAGPTQQCTWGSRHQCWALDIDSLGSISSELDPSELPPR